MPSSTAAAVSRALSLGVERVNVTISPASRATYVLHAQRGAVLFIPDTDFNIACTTLISAFFRRTPIGAQGDPIPIHHLIIIPQTIHISARCHLLPSSKENVKPHKVSLRATHHFFVLGFWARLHGVHLIDWGIWLAGRGSSSAFDLWSTWPLIFPPVRAGHISSAAASRRAEHPATVVRHQSRPRVKKPEPTQLTLLAPRLQRDLIVRSDSCMVELETHMHGLCSFFELAGARALGRPKEMAFFGNTWFWFFFWLVLGKDREVGKRTGVAYRACLVFLLCRPGLILLLFLAALPPRGGETGVVVVCSSPFSFSLSVNNTCTTCLENSEDTMLYSGLQERGCWAGSR